MKLFVEELSTACAILCDLLKVLTSLNLKTFCQSTAALSRCPQPGRPCFAPENKSVFHRLNALYACRTDEACAPACADFTLSLSKPMARCADSAAPSIHATMWLAWSPMK